jgi:hypothetical protein
LLVFGLDFVLVIGEIAKSPAREISYQGLMVPVVILLVVLGYSPRGDRHCSALPAR